MWGAGEKEIYQRKEVKSVIKIDDDDNDDEDDEINIVTV